MREIRFCAEYVLSGARQRLIYSGWLTDSPGMRLHVDSMMCNARQYDVVSRTWIEARPRSSTPI